MYRSAIIATSHGVVQVKVHGNNRHLFARDIKQF